MYAYLYVYTHILWWLKDGPLCHCCDSRKLSVKSNILAELLVHEADRERTC